MEDSGASGPLDEGHQSSPRRDRGGALFLLAHNDDEFFISPRILREKINGARVRVVFLTHGSQYGTPSRRRLEESSRALASMGVGASDLLALGEKQSIFDMALCENMDKAALALDAWLANDPPKRIYTHAWEGGHPDHDAAHLLGARLARRFGLRESFFEFPCYGGGTGPLARVMRLPAGEGALVPFELSLREGARALALVRYFPSQWKSLAGLLPEASLRLLLLRRASLRRVPERDYHSPPHSGALFYERRYHWRFTQFISLAGERFLRNA